MRQLTLWIEFYYFTTLTFALLVVSVWLVSCLLFIIILCVIMSVVLVYECDVRLSLNPKLIRLLIFFPTTHVTIMSSSHFQFTEQ